MILTDREIQIALAQGHLKIVPTPDAESYSSTSVDLTLGSRGVEWTSAPGMPIRPGARGYKYSSTKMLQRDISVNGYSLHPKSFLLAWTAEYVELPIYSRLAARVEGKSSLARLGVGVHVTAP